MFSFELVYFPITARAQTIRTILPLADANWKNRVPQWPQEKEYMPFAIERYLSRKFGFLPSHNQTAALLESYVFQISDSNEAFIYHATKARTVESNAVKEEQLRFLFK
ncbi:putative glutathione S-transferase 6 [Smittium culicis]|uniref:Putative glutathione S-transferase 6 n=1 Tax=Smittium culicis TaxID=133412 RepID=A0A1R1X340_9FUNG|nr:putative glutathione S-transferase 6 [Smittium culicis]